MKSACLTGIKEVSLMEIPKPERQGNEILVRVKSCGVCGSELHYYHDGRIGDQICEFPHLIGHEPSGVVEEVPEGSAFKPGDRVAIEPGLSCDECEHCQDGRINICPQVKFFGSPGGTGAFQEYVVVDESQLLAIPDNMSFDEAAMLEPLGIAYHSLINLVNFQQGETIGIFGAGAIGLLTMEMARYLGCGDSFVTDPLDYRTDFASRISGANNVANPEKTDIIKWVMDKTNGRGLDVTIDAAGTQQSIDHTFECARVGGRAILIGIPEAETITYNPHSMRRKELAIYNDRRSLSALKPCFDIVNAGKIDLKPYTTHNFSLDQIAEAYDIMDNYRDNIIRGMINP